MAYFLCKSGGGNLKWLKYADFDFTKSLTDSVRNISAQLSSSATIDADGLHIPTTAAYVSINDLFTFINSDHNRVEVDMGNGSIINTNNNNRFFMWTGTNGLIYRGNNGWSIYNGSWSSVFSTDKDLFNNSTLKVETLNNQVKIYKNGALLFTHNKGTQINTFQFGSSANSCANLNIKALRVYIENI